MRFIFILPAIVATLLTILIVGLTILSILRISILIPGLGLVVITPFLILLLAIVDAVIIILALLARRLSGKDFGEKLK